jgi:hypothetical protein
VVRRHCQVGVGLRLWLNPATMQKPGLAEAPNDLRVHELQVAHPKITHRVRGVHRQGACESRATCLHGPYFGGEKGDFQKQASAMVSVAEETSASQSRCVECGARDAPPTADA